MADIVDKIVQILEAPQDKEAFDSWLGMNSALDLLRENAMEDDFVVYASDRSTYIHAVLAPASLLNPPDVEDLMAWNSTPTSSWGVNVQYSESRKVWITPPLDHTGSKTVDRGEQLIFARDFDGRSGKKWYFEILQKFTHMFGLHYVEERHAYCRLDERGDVEDVIRIIERPGKGEEFGTDLITFKRELLDEYLVLTDSVIVRTFDFTRYRPGGFNGWRDGHDICFQSEGHMHYRSHIEPGYASYLRGIQLVHPVLGTDDVIARYDYRVKERQYASFLALDWKNNVLREISSARGRRRIISPNPISPSS